MLPSEIVSTSSPLVSESEKDQPIFFKNNLLDETDDVPAWYSVHNLTLLGLIITIKLT